jgi:hypothetical protein
VIDREMTEAEEAAFERGWDAAHGRGQREAARLQAEIDRLRVVEAAARAYRAAEKALLGALGHPTADDPLAGQRRLRDARIALDAALSAPVPDAGADPEWDRIMAKSEAEVDASLRAAGVDPERLKARIGKLIADANAAQNAPVPDAGVRDREVAEIARLEAAWKAAQCGGDCRGNEDYGCACPHVLAAYQAFARALDAYQRRAPMMLATPPPAGLCGEQAPAHTVAGVRCVLLAGHEGPHQYAIDAVLRALRPPADPPPAGPGEVDVFADIRAERARQDAKWGGPEHDDGHALVEWAHFIREHLDKALRGPFAKTRRRMVEVAALAVAAIEAWDRQEIAAGRQPPAVPAAGPELDLCSPSCGPTCPMCGGKYLELRDPPPAGPGEAASQAAPLPPHTLHLCRFCGSLWRCWASDGSWSLVTNIQPCPPCCDNVAMTADNMDPPPPAAPSPGEGEVERLAARAYNEYCRIVDDPAGDDPSISWGLLAPTTQKAWAAAVRAILSAAAGRR